MMIQFVKDKLEWKYVKKYISIHQESSYKKAKKYNLR